LPCFAREKCHHLRASLNTQKVGDDVCVFLAGARKSRHRVNKHHMSNHILHLNIIRSRHGINVGGSGITDRNCKQVALHRKRTRGRFFDRSHRQVVCGIVCIARSLRRCRELQLLALLTAHC